MYPEYSYVAGRRRGPRPAPTLALLVGLLVLAAGFLVAYRFAAPPAPVPADAPADAFSAERAWARLERLLGDGTPHPVGTPAGAAVRERLVAELEALGFAVELQDAWGCRPAYAVCADVTNVLTRLPGSGTGPALLLTAHYDSSGAGPGAADDMAAVAALVEVAGMLRGAAPLRNDVIFLFTDGEEVGLTGAEAFLEHPWAEDVGLIVNFEARGTGGQSLLFQTSEGNAWLIREFARVAPRPVTSSLLYDLYRLLPNDTDLSVYLEAGMAGINFAFVEGVERYHTALDDLAHLDRGSLQHHGDNALAAVHAFGDADLGAAPEGNALFQDVVPGSVLQAPEGWAVWLAVGALVLWLLVVMALLGAGAVSLGGLLLALLAVPLGLAVAAGLGYGVIELLTALAGSDAPWYAEPLPTRVAVWTAGALGFALVASFAAPRAGFWGMAAAAWAWWAGLALATALTLPGASVTFLLPTLVASFVYALLALFGVGLPTRDGYTIGWGAVLLALVSLFATAYLVLPLAYTIELGLGFEMGVAVAVPVALAVTSLAPLLAVPPGGAPARATLLGLAVLLLGASVVWALGVPAYSAERPQRLSVVHAQLADEGEPYAAHWLFQHLGGALPAGLASAAGFGGERVELPGEVGGFDAVATNVRGLAAPSLEEVRETRVGDERRLTFRLASPRGAERVTLLVPPAARATRLEVGAAGRAIEYDPDANEHQAFDCRGRACDGLELTLHVDADGPLELVLFDQTAGLPEGGEALLAARPATATPSFEGDVTLSFNRLLVGR
ncbi:MAG: M28 family peptidase [Deinococcales bacterium]|nr:M28 family peptidase [Deinococcales bacterium]